MKGLIRMFDSRLVDVFDPQPEDIVPINFIHAMSQINRFTGAAPFPISVGQHSLELYGYLKRKYDDPYYRKAALIHDWTEALFNDIATPVKKCLPTYKKHEHHAAAIIFDRFGVPFEYDQLIKPYDKRIYIDEVMSTWGVMLDSVWERDMPRLGIEYHEMHWSDVKRAMIAVFREEFPEEDLYT